MRLDSISTLPGLLPAIYRGISFHVVDSTSDAGRRVLEYLFPGVDPAAYDDFGVLPGIVSVEAVIVGDDYIARAKALQSAFETPGIATFIHPWLGPMSVILEEPGQISFSSRELRVARVSVAFKKVRASGGMTLLSAGSMLASVIGTVISVASALARSVDRRIISSERNAAVTRSTRVLRSTVTGIRPQEGTARFVSSLRQTAQQTLGTGGDGFDRLVLATSADLAMVRQEAAVAPAAEALDTRHPEPQSLMAISLVISASLVGQAKLAPAASDRSLLLSAAAHFLANGAVQSSYADFASKRDALAYRANAIAAIIALIDTLLPLINTDFQAEASALERALRDLQTAIVNELHEVIGRLPEILTFNPPVRLDAWQLAQHLAGDRPQLMERVYRDIITRNDPRHPSVLDDGAVEVLDIR